MSLERADGTTSGLPAVEFGDRIKALAERSSYVENVLRHSLVAGLSSAQWMRDPRAVLEVFNSEVDSAGFDLVLGLGSRLRYIQLKQAHADKVPTHCSVRLEFASVPGSCVVLMSYDIQDLRLTQFRFLGGAPSAPIGDISSLKPSRVPGRRNAEGVPKVRQGYRDVPVGHFQGPFTLDELLSKLFPLQVGV